MKVESTSLRKSLSGDLTVSLNSDEVEGLSKLIGGLSPDYMCLHCGLTKGEVRSLRFIYREFDSILKEVRGGCYRHEDEE